MFAFMYLAWIASVALISGVANADGEPVGLEFPVMNAAEGGETTFKTLDHPNDIFVFEVFFNTCPACNANADNVHALTKAYQLDTQVHVLELSTDSDIEDYQEWIEKHHPATGTLLKDVGHKFIKAEKVRYVPTVIVKDCKLETVYSYTGVWTTRAKDAITLAIEDAKQFCTVVKGDK